VKDLTTEEWAALGLLCQEARYKAIAEGNRAERDFYLGLQVKCDVRCAAERDRSQPV